METRKQAKFKTKHKLYFVAFPITKGKVAPAGWATGSHNFTALTYQWIKIWCVTERNPSAPMSILLSSYFTVVPMQANSSWCMHTKSDSRGKQDIFHQFSIGGQGTCFCNHPIHYSGHERWWRHQSWDGGGTSYGPGWERERSL